AKIVYSTRVTRSMAASAIKSTNDDLQEVDNTKMKKKKIDNNSKNK
ncbi:unnamed protein product, partial [Didymodactylos carnosus]